MFTNKELRRIGKNFTDGAIDSLARLLFFIIIVAVIMSYFTATDATDKSWLSRSGVKIITDADTGCQYLLGQSGGVVRREGIACGGKNAQ